MLCYYTFFYLETALLHINLKLTVKGINKKSTFQLSFIYNTIPHLKSCIEPISTIALSTVILFSNLNHAAWGNNNSSTIEWFQKSFENQILAAAKSRHPINYKKLMSEGIPIKLQLCHFVMFIAFVVAIYLYILFPLDFSMLSQDLGKFQKHCNVCLLVKLQLVKG